MSVRIKDLGECDIIATDEFTITVVVQGENMPRYLDREDYPELSAQCGYQKQVVDMIKDAATEANKDDFIYINIFDAFDTRQLSPTEVRTKLEDYLITFESLCGVSFIDDLNIEGTCVLVSKKEKAGKMKFDGIVASIEQMYNGGEDE